MTEWENILQNKKKLGSIFTNQMPQCSRALDALGVKNFESEK